jgi:hypothetical protein
MCRREPLHSARHRIAYNTFGKSGHRAPHWSFMLCAIFFGGQFTKPIDHLGIAAAILD